MAKNSRGAGMDFNRVVMSELGIDPLHMVKSSFALMGIIPILAIFYIIIGRHFLYHLLLGSDGFTMAVGILVSLTGFSYAYQHVRRMVERLLLYSVKLKRADEEKSAFVANVSHELRSPMAIIRESLEIIMDGSMGAVSARQKEFLECGQRNVNRLLRLVNDLLELSRIEAGKLQIKKEEVDIKELADEAVKTYEMEISKKQLLFKKEIEENMGSVWADKDKLTEVIINLLNNAIKYTPEKGSITMGLKGTDEEVRFEISDTGPGISEDSYEKVFNKFERITTEKREGTGLGLPIAKDIVELHNGKIWVESEVGRGSKFTFVLPRNLKT